MPITPYSGTVTFDEHIKSISYTLDGTAYNQTTSPVEIFIGIGNVTSVEITAVLDEGYVLDTITSGKITSDTTFTAYLEEDYASGGNGPSAINVTSKKVSSNIQINVNKNGTITLATKGTKNEKDIDINTSVTPSLEEKSITITSNGTTNITPSDNKDGLSKVIVTTNVSSTPTEEKTVDLDMASGNQVISPTSGKVLSKVTVTKPSTMLAENIKKDVNIGGVIGTLESGGADEETVYTEINAMTFGSTKYTVYLPDGYFDSSYPPQYSIDNGVTWNNFSSSSILKIRTTQIKFKVTGYFTSSGNGGNWSQNELYSVKLGMDITAGGSGGADESISDNYVLTQDIDDIKFEHNECCFVEGTQVLMADGSHKNIESITAGEKVLAYNENNNVFEIDTVTRSIINPNTIDLATIILSDNSKITFNAYHPFLTTEGFKSLTQHEDLPKLQIGDVLVSNENNLTIVSIEREQLSTPIKTYNLTILHNHNFLVGEKDSFVVAHNIACPI